jgi:hypothetical protein
VELVPKVCPHLSVTLCICDFVIDVPGNGKTIDMWIERIKCKTLITMKLKPLTTHIFDRRFISKMTEVSNCTELGACTARKVT